MASASGPPCACNSDAGSEARSTRSAPRSRGFCEGGRRPRVAWLARFSYAERGTRILAEVRCQVMACGLPGRKSLWSGCRRDGSPPDELVHAPTATPLHHSRRGQAREQPSQLVSHLTPPSAADSSSHPGPSGPGLFSCVSALSCVSVFGLAISFLARAPLACTLPCTLPAHAARQGWLALTSLRTSRKTSLSVSVANYSAPTISARCSALFRRARVCAPGLPV